MQAALPPNIDDAAFLGGLPLWLWLQDNGQRITPVTMRNIVQGQRLILSRIGREPLLVTAEHDAGEHVEVMGLHLRGVGYNDVVLPDDIHEGVWDLYILPNQIAALMGQVPAPAAPAVPVPAPAVPAAAAAAVAPDIYGALQYYNNHEIPNIPANSENILMGTPIVAGTEMVNLRGPDGRWNSELEEPRYYTYETFRQFPLKHFAGQGHFKEHPYTRSPLRPDNVRRYRANGGKRQKTNRKTRARRNRKTHRKN